MKTEKKKGRTSSPVQNCALLLPRAAARGARLHNAYRDSWRRARHIHAEGNSAHRRHAALGRHLGTGRRRDPKHRLYPSSRCTLPPSSPAFAFGQLMVIITQGTLEKLRDKMFNGMQRLPIRVSSTPWATAI